MCPDSGDQRGAGRQAAAELGDLPLAAAQAAGYLEQTDLPPADYLRRFRQRRAALLVRGEVVGYAGRIDTAWALSLERLQSENPAAVQLLELAAFLAPEPIPLALFGEHTHLLDEPLRSTAADPDALADIVGGLVGYSLARRHPDGFQIHRLVQAVIRHQLPDNRQQATELQVMALLAAAAPGDPDDPAGWPGYARLAPHVLATAPLGDSSPAGRQLVLDTTRYLHAHGDSSGGQAVFEQLLNRWRAVLGADHPDTLAAASTLTLALISVGDVQPARALGQDTLQRSRHVLGPDHPMTLGAATALTLALDQLGEAEPACALGEDTLRRCQQVFGRDHPTTLGAATALTVALVGLGKAEPARALAEDTLRRCRRVLGPDHATTLRAAAAALTYAVVEQGEAEPAHAVAQNTLQRCRRILGPDHPTTLWAATALTLALDLVGEAEPARALAEDTLQRCRRIHGSDHAITLWAATALTRALIGLGEYEPAGALAEDTLQRGRRILGPDHPLTRFLAQVAVTDHPPLGDDAAAEDPSPPR